MSYFANEDVQLKLLGNDSDTLRKCQHGGLLATVAHFTASTEPAILSLPTGAGKTELMFAAAFALEAERVLIIEPSRMLREQTADRLRKLDLFREHGIVNSDAPKPTVKEVGTSMRTTEDWEVLREFDAAVAHPKTTSPKEKLVCAPPDDLFDLVFIDEAHHAAAKTWRAIVRTFSDARSVLLTATAFRRDQRRLPGRLVYHYPIGQALEDGIYRQVGFIPVPQTDPDDIDRDIAEVTAEKMREERESNPDASLMIRTDRIAKCEDLLHLYEEFGIEAVEVHSDLKEKTALERLERLREGEVKAVVTVGMMAEGINIPSLKVGALHAPPRSLPYTLQIVGRMSRNPDSQTGPATFVASPEQVRGQARRLFREDRDWRKFIPDLVEDAIRDAHSDRADIILSDPDASSLLPEVLTPYFSVEVERFNETTGKVHDERFPLDLDDVRGLPKDVEHVEALAEVDEGCVSIITRSTPTPSWGKETRLLDTQHDLHILYAPPSTDFLFSATTSKVVMKALRGALVDQTKKVAPQNLRGALEEARSNEYTAVGLENALGLTGNHPSYRMHLGAGSGSSVRPSDGSVYGAGHVTGRMLNDEFRGIATQNRRVWAMRREPMKAFTEWCREIASQLATPGSSLPGLSFLAQPVAASALFDEEPIGIVASDRHFGLPDKSLVQSGEETREADQNAVLTFEEMDDGAMKAALAFREDEPPVSLSYRANAENQNWKLEDERDFQVADPSSGERKDLEDFLEEHPPIILMPNGGAIRGDYGWKITQGEPDLPEEMFRHLDWSSTDIRKEADDPENGEMNVSQKTLQEICGHYPADTIVMSDDAAYEISDLIVIDPNRSFISFVHCKYSGEDSPGNRVKDWYELFGQCARSHTWVRNGRLLHELDDRIDRRQDTRLVSGMGSREDLKILAADFKSNEWTYGVRAVQPGCDIDKLLREPDSNVFRGLGVVREWLMQAGASFEVWGSRQ